MSARTTKAVIGALFSVLLLTASSEAFAIVAGTRTAGGPAAVSDGTIGGVVLTVINSFGNFTTLLAAFCYIAGLFLAAVGVFKFKDHVDSPSQHPLSAGVKRFLAGGMLLSTPYMGGAAYHSLFAGAQGDNNITRGDEVATRPGGEGMDQMIYDLIMNVASPMQTLLVAFTYISAIIFLMSGIVRLTKTAQDGPRGPAGMGTIMTFLVAGALFAFGDMMGAFSNSLFGNNQVFTYATISDTVISDAEDKTKITAVIQSIMIFIMIVGYIAFIRGWFVLRSFADGNSSVSLAQALTFMFGGAVAINMGQFVNVLQNTIGVNGITF